MNMSSERLKHSSGTLDESIPLNEATYVHESLNEHEFRLLEILPKAPSDGSPIRCNIHAASFEGAAQPDYEAISYVWGDPTPSSTIHINGRPFKLPTNSEKALRRMAKPTHKRTVYLDAVCINQADLEERKAQVLLMGRIYRNAQMTLVYAGDANESTEAAMRNLEALAEEMQGDIDRNNDDGNPGVNGILWDQYHRQRRSWFPPKTQMDEMALMQLLGRPWFRRVWVVQEVALSRKSVLLCGPFELDMDVVLDVATWLFRYHGNHLGYLSQCLLGLQLIWDIRHNLMRGNYPTLDYLLEKTRELYSSDLRDKVYGMLGIMGMSDFSVGIVPDYTLTAFQVIRNATRQSLATSAWALAAVRHEKEADLYRTDLPSWVPRLDRPTQGGVDAWPLPDSDPYKRSSTVIAKLIDYEGRDPNVLNLSGIILGRITEVSTLLDNADDPDILLDWCTGITEFLAGRWLHMERIGRILLSDTNIESQPGGPNDYRGLSMALKKRHWIPIPQITNTTDEGVAQASRFIPGMTRTCFQRKIAITSNETICVVPKLTQPSDIVVSLRGGLMPLVLRPHGEGYVFLGECYVDGYMSWQRHGVGIRKRLLTEVAQPFAVR